MDLNLADIGMVRGLHADMQMEMIRVRGMYNGIVVVAMAHLPERIPSRSKLNFDDVEDMDETGARTACENLAALHQRYNYWKDLHELLL